MSKDDMAKARRAAHSVASELLNTWELGRFADYMRLDDDGRDHVRLLLTRWADWHFNKSLESNE